MNKKILLLSLIALIPHTRCADMESFWTGQHIKSQQGFWGYVESASGPGSSMEQTAAIRPWLASLIKQLNISSMLDLPCGDFHWMKAVDLGQCRYIGCDIMKMVIEDNEKKYGNEKIHFLHNDVTKDEIPYAELILCRDLLVHLSFDEIRKALRIFKRSGAKYLLTTTFSIARADMNSDIETGNWRSINLQKPPFNFPNPLFLINENCSEADGAYKDKSLGLWLLDQIEVL